MDGRKGRDMVEKKRNESEKGGIERELESKGELKGKKGKSKIRRGG